MNSPNHTSAMFHSEASASGSVVAGGAAGGGLQPYTVVQIVPSLQVGLLASTGRYKASTRARETSSFFIHIV